MKDKFRCGCLRVVVKHKIYLPVLSKEYLKGISSGILVGARILVLYAKGRVRCQINCAFNIIECVKYRK